MMRAVRSLTTSLHIREIFFEHAAFVVGDARDVARRHAHAVVGKDAVGGGLLQQRNFGRAESDRQVRRQFRSDAEALGIVDHAPDADFVRQLERGNIARLSQRAAQRDDAFEFLVVIVRSVGTGGRFEADGFVEDGVVGRWRLRR